MIRRLLLPAAAAAALAACSSSTPPAPPPDNPNLTILAQDIKFDKTEYTASAGQVAIAYVSDGNQVHNFVIEDANKNKIPPKLKVSPGESTGATYTLAAGTYSIYCDIAGHKQSMNGKLIVT